MGKSKKKPFIDKKNSSTFHLLYRSQRDVADANDETIAAAAGGGVVLWPSPDNNQETNQKVLKPQKITTTSKTLSSWEQELAQAGLVETFDFEQHLKPITGSGIFFDASTGHVGNEKKSSRNNNKIAATNNNNSNINEEIVQEVDRQLESIALTADCMDDDIAQALFGDFDDGEYEELNDEFVLDAAAEPEIDNDDSINNNNQSFDFATHVQKLMERAKLEREANNNNNLNTIHEQGQQDLQFFAKHNPIHHGNDNDVDSWDGDYNYPLNDDEIATTTTMPGVVPKLSPAEERALCEKFEATLAEYDDDEIGEMYDTEIHGDRPLEGDVQLEQALDDFMQERQDDIFMQGTNNQEKINKNGGGNGFHVLVGTRMVPAKELNNNNNNNDASHDVANQPPIEQVLADANIILSNPLEQPPAEEIFIDGKSYYSEKMRNPWDCESILSTYSNLDNNPATIGVGGSGRRGQRRKQQKKKQQEQKIILSEKTGLPLNVLPGSSSSNNNNHNNNDQDDDDDLDETIISVNKGQARKKTETPQEKRLRKAAVKQERQIARMQKKMMKEVMAEEFSKRTNEVVTDDVGGKTVFRF